MYDTFYENVSYELIYINLFNLLTYLPFVIYLLLLIIDFFTIP